MTRARLLATRAVPLAALALLSTVLLLGSTLWALLPTRPPGALVLALVALLYVPALLTRATPLPATLAVLVPVLAAGSYGQSRLDWLRLLKDFDVTQQDPTPDVLRMVLSLVALLLVWALHVVDHATRLRAHALQRGVDPREADGAARLVVRVGALRALVALAATLLLALVAGAAWLARAERLLAGRAALLAPLVAALLIAGGALALARHERKSGAAATAGAAPSADERE